jgi:hypothetical protein
MPSGEAVSGRKEVKPFEESNEWLARNDTNEATISVVFERVHLVHGDLSVESEPGTRPPVQRFA